MEPEVYNHSLNDLEKTKLLLQGVILVYIPQPIENTGAKIGLVH